MQSAQIGAISMELNGTIHNGVVVLDNGESLPEGTLVKLFLCRPYGQAMAARKTSVDPRQTVLEMK